MSNDKIIKKSESFEIREKGEAILENHDFFRDLSEIMEDKKCAKFFKKYFSSLSESKISIVYMKLYEEFKNKWKQLTDTELDKRINIYLLWKMMRDSEANKFALHTVLSHMENPKKKDLFEDIKDFMIISEKYMKLADK
tara:strand:- start:335 stop:751 length:417 start_codon:yes stop_codon:yes gene_type:complete